MQPRKMTLAQPTFIVAVNMMGSGIIMLPANMAQVGAISLLSWLVTAVGSMAIAYGFAQAGLFNQREGGMSAYAEDAYGKSGYFLVFYLYFLSLAIGNVAIASSAVGYLSAFVPWLSSTPIMTCLTVIGLLWLTTVANFGGPKVTGRIGSITVWGVIIPVGLLSIFGWFWFRPDTFAAAWNPKGLSLVQGMGSSIALTLWAFLGMESAAQNSAAVEDPKRNVPLACLFGTLGAAVIYILSTTVIQGIVPNAELAKSTGPFGLAYARMFNPAVGTLIMGLAVVACLGSLLGWQFTIAQTAKSAADQRMFPRLFGAINRMGAPVAGMVIMGIAQSLLALATISPTLSQQFSALVNLAVVTNVVPYIIALSALPVMMQADGITNPRYRSNVLVALVAMAYSVFAIYASGKDAVFGGMLAWGIGLVIWGFIAPRFASGAEARLREAARAASCGRCRRMTMQRRRSEPLFTRRRSVAIHAVMLAAAVTVTAAQTAPTAAGTLARTQTANRIRFGYRVDARPFSYQHQSGNAAGYSIALCQRIAGAVERELGVRDLSIDWVPIPAEDRFRAVQQGTVDLLYGADTVTLGRRTEVAFSIPIFPGGISALLRADAPVRLREALSGRQTPYPIWRASASRALQARSFGAVQGTTAAKWLPERFDELEIATTVSPVNGYEARIQAVLARRADALFGERAILLDAARRHAAPRDLLVIDRLFTYEPMALTLAADDDRFRLLVDRTLSRFYGSGEFGAFYTKWFGKPDESAINFFRWSTIPD